MAYFRFRVVSVHGIIAGFHELADAQAFAQAKTKETGAYAVISEFPHGNGKEGKILLAAFLNGDRL